MLTANIVKSYLLPVKQIESEDGRGFVVNPARLATKDIYQAKTLFIHVNYIVYLILTTTLAGTHTKLVTKAPAMTTKPQSDADVALESDYDRPGDVQAALVWLVGPHLSSVKEPETLIMDYILGLERRTQSDAAARTKTLVEALKVVQYGLKEGYLQDFLMGNGDKLSEVVEQALAQEKGAAS